MQLDLPLAGDGIVIGPLLASDAPALAESHSDPANARFQAWPSPLSECDAARFIEAQGADWPLRPGGGVQLALRTATGGALVGDLYLALPADRSGDLDVGITMVPGCHGRGLASAAIRALVSAVAVAPGATVGRVVAFVDEDNLRSRRLFERCGFELVGRDAGASRRRDGTTAGELTYARRPGASSGAVV